MQGMIANIKAKGRERVNTISQEIDFEFAI